MIDCDASVDERLLFHCAEWSPVSGLTDRPTCTLYLQQFHLEVKFRKEVINGVADNPEHWPRWTFARSMKGHNYLVFTQDHFAKCFICRPVCKATSPATSKALCEEIGPKVSSQKMVPNLPELRSGSCAENWASCTIWHSHMRPKPILWKGQKTVKYIIA